jgi:hypothetical protein
MHCMSAFHLQGLRAHSFSTLDLEHEKRRSFALEGGAGGIYALGRRRSTIEKPFTVGVDNVSLSDAVMDCAYRASKPTIASRVDQHQNLLSKMHLIQQ